jgi:hypothetical protein
MMPIIQSRALSLRAMAWSCAVLLVPAGAAAEKWKAPNPSELALAAPAIEKDADAEVLEWDVRVAEELQGEMPVTVFDHYVRMKIFTDRGRDTYGRVDITHADSVWVSEVEARTIGVDGSIRELQRAEIFRRTLVKGEGAQLKAVTFALPGVQRGSIIEYGWKERHSDSLAANLRLSLQRDVPVHVVRYHIKPAGLEDYGYGMRVSPFQIELAPLRREGNGFYLLSAEKIPALRQEPNMPPEHQVGPWALLHYARLGAPTEPLAFWKDFVKRQNDEARDLVRPTDEIRRAAAQACASAASPEQKISALVRHVRSQIQRTDVDTAPPDLDREGTRDRSAKEVLKRGKGDAADLLVVFLALAQAAGLDARLAFVADRADIDFNARILATAQLPGRLAAIQVNGAWRFVDPASRYSTDAHPRWWHEGQAALVSGPKDVEFLATPVSAPEQTGRRRVGRFRLQADGSLEGELSVEYTGHWGAGLKEGEDEDTPAERVESFKTLMSGRLPGAEVTDIRIENVTTADAPYRVSARLRMPGYAQRTGARLIFQPNVFERGIDSLFTSNERRTPVFFQYARLEEDEVTIELPAGFAPEPHETLAPLAVRPAFSHAVAIQIADGKLVLRRRSMFSDKEMLAFEPRHYETLKDYFTRVHQHNAAAISLKRATTAP